MKLELDTAHLTTETLHSLAKDVRLALAVAEALLHDNPDSSDWYGPVIRRLQAQRQDLAKAIDLRTEAPQEADSQAVAR